MALHDTATGGLVTTAPDGPARLYVCGITPYDATHMGHAATYVAFDLLNRAWRNAGHEVVYVQNVTDVDDPLLERATKVNVDWTELAERETELFRQDMTALRVLPPDHYIGAVESIPLVVALIERLQEAGAVYQVEDDLYFSVTADPAFGEESGFDRDTMLAIFPERGGDPDRPGKKDPLDCVVWRGPRDGEPSWDEPVRPGPPRLAHRVRGDRPGAPRRRPSTCRAAAATWSSRTTRCAPATPRWPTRPGRSPRSTATPGWWPTTARRCRSRKGNLVFVSALRNSDVDPMAIRLVLLRHHYRSDWEWLDAELWDAVDTLADWRRALSLGAGAPAAPGRDRGAGRAGRRPRRPARRRRRPGLGRRHPRHHRPPGRHQRRRRGAADPRAARRRAGARALAEPR